MLYIPHSPLYTVTKQVNKQSSVTALHMEY